MLERGFGKCQQNPTRSSLLHTRLEIRNDQRLVISQMLAQPFEMIPEIDNMPWDLKEKDVTSKGMNWISLQERQNELYPE